MGLLDTMTNVANTVVDSKPSVVKGTVTGVYGNAVSVSSDMGGFENILCIGSPRVDVSCILVPVDDGFVCVPDIDSYTRAEVDEIVQDIISGDIDLKDYVRKADLINNTEYDVDLNLSFGTRGFDDTITIDMDIVDHVVSKIIRI